MLLFATIVFGARFLSLERDTVNTDLRLPLARLEEDFRLVASFLGSSTPVSFIEKESYGSAPKNVSRNEGAQDMLETAKNVPVTQMPLLLGFMKEMYDRFKHNIAKANEMEAKSKSQYKQNLVEKKKWPKRYLEDKAMMNLANHWDKQRELSHKHYHNMLKLSHAGMERLKAAIDMMEKAIAGKPLDTQQMQNLREMAPEVVLVEISSLVRFSRAAIAEFEKKPTGLSGDGVRVMVD